MAMCVTGVGMARHCSTNRIDYCVCAEGGIGRLTKSGHAFANTRHVSTDFVLQVLLSPALAVGDGMPLTAIVVTKSNEPLFTTLANFVIAASGQRIV